MIKIFILMILAALILTPVGILIWGLTPVSPSDALSGGKTTNLMMFGSLLLMAVTVAVNAILLIAIKALKGKINITTLAPLLATGIQSLMIGFSYEWISVAKAFETNYTILIFAGLVLAAHSLFFASVVWLFGHSD